MKGEQMRFTVEELAKIRAAFKGNVELLKVLRKVFLPELDATAPLGQNLDLYLTLDIRDMDAEQAKTLIVARNEVIRHIESQLAQLHALAEMDEKSAEEKAADAKKDSAK